MAETGEPDTIDAVRADLARASRNPDQVQWADAQTSWDEGTAVCSWDEDRFVVRRLGRTEDGDRVEHFASEAEAAAQLRRALVDVKARRTTPEEQVEIRERMQRRAAEIKARLATDRPAE